jgi:PAS domain S-box-containing protein
VTPASSLSSERPVARMGPPSNRPAIFALGFVIASLFALVVVPLWVGTRTQAVRQELRTIVEPARAEADRMVTQFDRQVALVRGYRLSGEAHYLARFRAAHEERLDAERELQPLAEQLRPPAPALLDEFGRAAAAWEASHQRFILPDGSAEEIPGATGTREGEYDAVISAGDRLEAQLRRETADRRQQIQREERRGLVLSAILALMALAATLVVAGISQRLRVYGRETERLYEESEGLATQLGKAVGTLQQRTTEAEAEAQERRRAELALRAEEERFRAMADNIPQLAWMADRTGAISWYNRRWYEYTGTTFEEVQGWGGKAATHPDHLERVAERFRRAIAEEQPWEDTFPLRSGEGEYRWFLSRAMPIRDEQGKVTLWFGTNTDITEQREATAEREQLAVEIDRQRSLLKTVTDNATSALLVMDTQGRGTFWNPAAERMTGYTAEEAIGRTLHELIHHTYPDGTPFPIEACPIDLALPRGVEVGGYEDVFIRKNGEFFPVVCAAKPIVENGRPAGTVIEVRDVTREKQAEEALVRAKEEAEQANRAKSEFLATMSHELRTPLNAILGFADLMDMGIPEPLPETTRSQVRRIDGSARHLLDIIEQILTFSRVEAEQEKVAAEIIDLRELIRSVARMAEPLAEKKGLHLVCDLDRAPAAIRSDPQKLRQILINLLGNAIKFMEAGVVELTAWQENGEVFLRVRDTGIGIPPEQLSRVFDPFWQVDQSHTRSAGGTGLGLTVSRSLAHLLGGDIHVQSEPGVGSTFEVRLPLHVESRSAMTHA